MKHDKFTRLRFTGTRIATNTYQAPGTRKFLFGNNRTRFQCLVFDYEAQPLKEKYEIELLELPLDMAHDVIPLATLINTSDLFATGVKDQLLLMGYETLGEVIATNDITQIPGGIDTDNIIRDFFKLPRRQL